MTDPDIPDLQSELSFVDRVHKLEESLEIFVQAHQNYVRIFNDLDSRLTNIEYMQSRIVLDIRNLATVLQAHSQGLEEVRKNQYPWWCWWRRR